MIAFFLFFYMMKISDESKPQDEGDTVSESDVMNPEDAAIETPLSQSQAQEEVSSALVTGVAISQSSQK